MDFARPYWGSGYAGGAARAVTEDLLGEGQLQEVRAWSHVDNLASRRVLLSAGFHEIGQEGEQITFVRRAESRNIDRDDRDRKKPCTTPHHSNFGGLS